MNTKEKLAYALAEHVHEPEYFYDVILPVAERFGSKCKIARNSTRCVCDKCGQYLRGSKCKNYDSNAYIVALLRVINLEPDVLQELFGGKVKKDIVRIWNNMGVKKEIHINQIARSKNEIAKRVKIAELKHLIKIDPDSASEYKAALEMLEA